MSDSQRYSDKYKARAHYVALSCATLLLMSLALSTLAQVEPDNVTRIPAASITRLQDQLAELETLESTGELRRACKKIIRGSESLISQHPDSPDRYRVLGIEFETQKAMFSMRQTDEYRKALVETAQRLLEAPDAYAEQRVEPDMMLLQMQLDRENASAEDRAMAIAQFADRYRETPAEAMSLMMATTVAFDLGNRDLLAAFRRTLSKGYSADPLVMAFMRERFGTGSEFSLRGAFLAADGKRMSFPLGQTYIVCFWSIETPLLEERVREIKTMQERYKDTFRVFSFNLDELHDFGASVLTRMELDWVPMRLVGGESNETYLSVGGANAFAAFAVGPHGLASKGATGQQSAALHKVYEAVSRTPRQAALLRSLCIGDYLLAGSDLQGVEGIPTDTATAIQACFPPGPVRYRLTPTEERKNYESAAALCSDAVAAAGKSTDLWRLHNHQTIALMGLWRLSGELNYLDQAVRSATAALKAKLPPGGRVVPCVAIATKSIVDGGEDALGVLASMIQAAGGDDAPGLAYAAAMMLALEAHEAAAFVKYRDMLLKDHAEDPSTWRVSSQLLDPVGAASLFERALPTAGRGMSEHAALPRRFRGKWQTLDGERASVGSTGTAINAIAFLEPASEGNAAALAKRIVDHLVRKAAERGDGAMAVTVVHRGDDTNMVAEVMRKNKWDCKAGFLDDDGWSRMSDRFGVISADRMPNVFLVDPVGSILLAITGAGSHGARPETITMRIDVALREYSLELAEMALAEGDYAKYAARLATAFPLKHRRLSRHEPASRAVSVHGRQLTWAYMQAEDWPRALAAANANIKAQQPAHNPKDTATWCKSCHGYLHAMCLRITLLRMMGAEKKLSEAMAMFSVPACPHGKTEADLWKAVEADRKGRTEHPRFHRYSDPKVYLAAHEGGMRAGRQSLYKYGVASDLMMRAEIHEKLGMSQQAEADRKQAQLRAWPFAVREYDPAHLLEAAIDRRQLARRHLESGEWNDAIALVSRNIKIHEEEAVRCNSMCKICSAQVQSLGFYVRTLDGLGRTKEAESARSMAELCRCPPGKELQMYKAFPVNRMYGGGSGINRLNFIRGVMTGENHYANRQDRIYRIQLASDLVIRSEALQGLGDAERAAADMARATALAYPLGPNTVLGSDELPPSYAELLGRDDE